MKPSFVKARCIEIECPIWGWVKIPFSIISVYHWNDCRDSGYELTFKCPACGEDHEIYPSP
jgi:hypothetical protein